MAAIITVSVQLYIQIYWVSAKTGFDKRRRWSQSFPLPNFSASVLVVEAGDFRYIFPDYRYSTSKYTPLYSMRDFRSAKVRRMIVDSRIELPVLDLV